MACVNPVKALYVTGFAGNSGWRDLQFGTNLSTQAFEYSVPATSFDKIRRGPLIVINPYQPNTEARFHIESVVIVEAGKGG